MKIVNIMNFARGFEPRNLDVEKKLLKTTADQLDLVNELGLDATFLLQYEVLCDDDFISMIKSKAGDNIELGFWYEVVEPLTTACGMPYESEFGWKWDWHIKPGFTVSYTLKDREILIDEAMRKFKEVFGYYPRTVGSWLLDTHTVNYLAENYELDALCYCRDQVNTDAYTFIGGYFNQGYYPSKNNYFTPAQSEETQVNVPIFRLLGSDPIHNYDGGKYASEEHKKGPYTMEPVYDKTSGGNPKIVDWYLDSYFKTEDLGFSYMQIGQENSFAQFELIKPIRMQIEKVLALGDVKIEKMCDTGKAFKKKFKDTPATSVCALTNWDSVDCQSVYYDSVNYTANIVRVDNKVFIRALYLFDDRIKDYYEDTLCSTFDAVYENLPIVDTVYQKGDTDGGIGLILDDNGCTFDVKKSGEEKLTVFWGDKSVIFKKDRIILNNCKCSFTYYMFNTDISVNSDTINYKYKNTEYSLKTENCTLSKNKNTIHLCGDSITIIPTKA